MRGLFFRVIETNCIRQLERQLLSASYNHNMLTTLRTSVKESPACIQNLLQLCNDLIKDVLMVVSVLWFKIS